VIAGLATVMMGMAGFLMPRVRNVESELPDMVGEEQPETK